MKLTKEMLDVKVKEIEIGAEHNMTYRQYLQAMEDELCVPSLDFDSMTDDELNEYDSWLCDLVMK